MKAKLEFLTGTKKGSDFELKQGETTIGRERDRDLMFSSTEEVKHVSRTHATVFMRGDQWIVRDDGSSNGTFVNNEELERRGEREIQTGDVLTFGLNGPQARFAVEGEIPRTELAEVPPTVLVGDAEDASEEPTEECAPETEDTWSPGIAAGTPKVEEAGESGQRPRQGTVTTLFQEYVVNRSADKGRTEAFKDFMSATYATSKRQTRILVGSTLGLSAVAIAAVAIWSAGEQARIEAAGKAQIAEVQRQAEDAMGSLSLDLATEVEARQGAEQQVADLSSAFRQVNREQEEALSRLQDRLDFGEEVANTYRAGVVLVAFEIRFYDQTSSQLVRFALNDSTDDLIWRFVRDSTGNVVDSIPMATTEGTGPAVELASTGTAFLIHEDGWLLTNRHIVDPTYGTERERESVGRMLTRPVVARFVNFRAYPPPGRNLVPFSVEAISDQADVALIKADRAMFQALPLPLSPAGRTPTVGQDIALIGYPTGLTLLLFRADRDSLRATFHPGLDVTQYLRERNLIWPLVQQGSLADVTGAELVFAMEGSSTGGSSGSPLIGANRTVEGVNWGNMPASDAPTQLARAAPIRFAWELFPPELADDLRQRLEGE